MDDLIGRIEALQKFHDEQTKLNADILKMFELAGYDMDTEPVDGKCRPKEAIELIREVLDDPPEEPQRWIRIQDIPNYIDDYLIYPDRQTIDQFNDRSAPARRSGVQQQIHELDNAADVPEEDTRTVNDKGELDPEFKLGSKSWPKAGMVPVGQTVVDEIGELWYKVAANKWARVNGFDENAPDYDLDIDVTAFAPLREVLEK